MGLGVLDGRTVGVSDGRGVFDGGMVGDGRKVGVFVAVGKAMGIGGENRTLIASQAIPVSTVAPTTAPTK